MIRFIFVFILIILFFGILAVMAVFGIIRSFLGFGKKKNQNIDEQQNGTNSSDKKSKMFDKNEGEYVDYEDIKD